MLPSPKEDVTETYDLRQYMEHGGMFQYNEQGVRIPMIGLDGHQTYAIKVASFYCDDPEIRKTRHIWGIW